MGLFSALRRDGGLLVLLPEAKGASAGGRICCAQFLWKQNEAPTEYWQRQGAGLNCRGEGRACGLCVCVIVVELRWMMGHEEGGGQIERLFCPVRAMQAKCDDDHGPASAAFSLCLLCLTLTHTNPAQLPHIHLHRFDKVQPCFLGSRLRLAHG